MGAPDIDTFYKKVGVDLIVSFAIPGLDPYDVKSLTLLRTPKYEFIWNDAERGVNVS